MITATITNPAHIPTFELDARFLVKGDVIERSDVLLEITSEVDASELERDVWFEARPVSGWGGPARFNIQFGVMVPTWVM